jgi:hypothetical protein
MTYDNIEGNVYPKGLAQPVAGNVDGHSAGSMSAVAWFESLKKWVRHTTLHQNRFNRDATHKCGEHSFGFLVKFSMEQKNSGNV